MAHKFAIIADEPYEINGNTNPLGGTSPMTTPRLKIASAQIIMVNDAARNILNASRALLAI